MPATSPQTEDIAAPRATVPVPTPAPAPRTEGLGFMPGDDLARARAFCDAARTAMDGVIAAFGENLPPPDPHALAQALCGLQSDAKRARARAVYRSAQDVMRLLHTGGLHMPIDWGQVEGRLFVLNKLIMQYEVGLAEVETAQASEPVPTRIRRNGPVSGPNSARDSARFHAAAQTLSGVIHTSDPQDRPALRLLMGWRPDAEAPVDATPRDCALADAMPDLVQRLLGHGRDYGKTLSVSYALDTVWLTDGGLDAAVEALWTALQPRIAADLPLQGVGHVDIQAEGDERLRVSGSGFAAFDIALGDAAPTTETRPMPTPQPTRPTAPKPMITPDTEADLRAQLAALLDGTQRP